MMDLTLKNGLESMDDGYKMSDWKSCNRLTNRMVNDFLIFNSFATISDELTSNIAWTP